MGFGVSVGLGVAVGATVSCTASVASIDATSVLSFTESAVFIVSEFPMATANEMMNAIAIIRDLNSLLFLIFYRILMCLLLFFSSSPHTTLPGYPLANPVFL